MGPRRTAQPQPQRTLSSLSAPPLATKPPPRRAKATQLTADTWPAPTPAAKAAAAAEGTRIKKLCMPACHRTSRHSSSPQQDAVPSPAVQLVITRAEQARTYAAGRGQAPQAHAGILASRRQHCAAAAAAAAAAAGHAQRVQG